VTTTKPNRFRARYERRKERGDVCRSVWFTPQTDAVLRALCERTGMTHEQAIASALLNASVQYASVQSG